MMKVNEMLMYVSEMKLNLHDNHRHQNDIMAVVDMRMKVREERNLETGTQVNLIDTV